MPRHSFVRMSKLTNVQGRVDYISNPKRQEHLYAVYSTVDPPFWERLHEQAQYDFWKSNQPSGKCIEARELIIALPESMTAADPNELLKVFTETFRMKYGVQCTSAFHHNKSKTNYHIHLVFADRDVLEKTEVKYASRNMFFNEDGRHVRTKKEILDADGNIRPKCRIVPKGEPYEVKWFSGRKEVFKSKKFLSDVKELYTDLINQIVTRDEDRLQVFDAAGPYLPTKKIGKNNPMESEISADNELRREWNQTVDQVLIAGGTHEEVTDFKTEEVVQKIAISVSENGNQPGLFSNILRVAIAVLKEFLEILMSKGEDKIERTAKDVKPEKVKTVEKDKGARPDSRKEVIRFQKAEFMHKNLTKKNRKLYALQKQRSSLQLALDQIPKSIFNRKDRKALEDRIDGIGRQIEKTSKELEFIPKQYGFANVKEAEAEYRSAKAALEAVLAKQAEWDGVPVKVIQPKTYTKKPSVLKQLAAERRASLEKEKQNNNENCERNGGRKHEYESL